MARRTRVQRSAGVERGFCRQGFMSAVWRAIPSSVLMNAIPAEVACVETGLRWLCPAGWGFEPLVLFGRTAGGVDESLPHRGAAGVAALAYGTGTRSRPSDKITAPGNAYALLPRTAGCSARLASII